MTRNDVISAAYRRLGIVAIDDVMTADQLAYGAEVLDGVFAEVQAEAGVALVWDLGSIPDSSGRLLANLLAVDIAPAFMAAPPEARGMAFLRLLGSIRPDNRETAEAVYF